MVNQTTEHPPRVIPCDCPSCEKHRAVKAAAATERTRIIAWLRKEGSDLPPVREELGWLYGEIADAIERGDHVHA